MEEKRKKENWKVSCKAITPAVTPVNMLLSNPTVLSSYYYYIVLSTAGGISRSTHIHTHTLSKVKTIAALLSWLLVMESVGEQKRQLLA